MGRRHAPTFDRIEPRLGYVRSNIAVISASANRIKSNARASEIAALGRWAGEQETSRSHPVRASNSRPVGEVPEAVEPGTGRANEAVDVRTGKEGPR